MKTFIVARFELVGFHYWLHAPEEVKFLRSNHRHKFYFEIKKAVGGLDREVEFITFGAWAKQFVIDWFGKEPIQFGAQSCEMIAKTILEHLDCQSVCVFEDNENGGCAEQ